MKKRNRIIVIITILLIISIGNYFRMESATTIRNVDFFSIFVIGALSGLLINQVVMLMREKKE